MPSKTGRNMSLPLSKVENDPTMISLHLALVIATLSRRGSLSNRPTRPFILLRTNEMTIARLSRPW